MVGEEILMVDELLMSRHQKSRYVILEQSTIQGSAENNITRPVSTVSLVGFSPAGRRGRVDGLFQTFPRVNLILFFKRTGKMAQTRIAHKIGGFGDIHFTHS